VERPARPPGGKALLRLLQLLESRGYGDTADTTLRRVLNEDVMDEFASRTGRQYGLVD